MSTGKDPAFLFYPADFLVGTMMLTYEERGKYITLLCALHQHGRLTEDQVTDIIGNLTHNLRSKFQTDKNGKIYNKRLEDEIKKRSKWVKSRRNNGAKGGRPKKPSGKPNGKPNGLHMDDHMGNENENENISIYQFSKEQILKQEKGEEVDEFVLAASHIYKLIHSVHGEILLSSFEFIQPLRKLVKDKKITDFREMWRVCEWAMNDDFWKDTITDSKTFANNYHKLVVKMRKG